MSPDGVYGKEEWAKDPAAAMEEARRRIEYVCETGETWLFLSDLYALEALPPELERCGHIERLDVGDADGPDGVRHQHPNTHKLSGWERLSQLHDLQRLNLRFTSFSDVSLLSGMTALQSLDCGYTQVADLSPLSGLTALRSLDCRDTQVADLSPLSGLTTLQSLDCGGTQVADLLPLSGLTALQSLVCGGTQVADLSPLSGMTALQSLYCWDTQVADLSPLSGMTALQSLDCGGTQVADLLPLSGLTALQSLFCGGTKVADLSPLSPLPRFTDGEDAMRLWFSDIPLTKDGRWAKIAGLKDPRERTRRAVALLRELGDYDDPAEWGAETDEAVEAGLEPDAAEEAAAQQARAAAAGGLEAVIRNGRVGFTQRPADQDKPYQNDPALRAIIDEQIARMRQAIRHIQRSTKNFDKALLLPQFEDYLAYLSGDDPEILNLKMVMEVLAPNVADDFLRPTLDAGSLNILDQIVACHPDVIFALDKAPEPAPELVIDEDAFDEEEAEAIVIDFTTLVEGDAGREAIDPEARRSIGDILKSIRTARRERAEEDEAQRNRRRQMLRRNVIRAAWVLGVLSGASTLTGITALEAWAMLYPQFQQLMVNIARFFIW